MIDKTELQTDVGAAEGLSSTEGASLSDLLSEDGEVQTVIEAEISLSDIYAMKPPVPLEVQMRLWLNSKGFRFLDDGKPSLIVNMNPTPIGAMYKDENFEHRTIRFKQILNT